MKVRLPNGMIVEDDDIPKKYRKQNYVLEWSDDNGGIYVVTNKKQDVPLGG